MFMYIKTVERKQSSGGANPLKSNKVFVSVGRVVEYLFVFTVNSSDLKYPQFEGDFHSL